MYEKYNHHGKEAVVKSELKGKHRKHCLCFEPCKHFTPEDRKNNCKIANAVYKNCVDFHIVTPVWECPEFEKGA